MFGPAAMRFLAEVELRESPRRRLDSTLALIADFTREIDLTTREIEARAKDDAYVDVLCQIRGVGRYIAMLVIAEVGDVTRFRTARQLCSWAGMTPTVRSSDMRTRLGHISRQGSPALRWALVEAAQHASHGGGPLRQAFERIAKPPGRQGRGRPQNSHALLLRLARRSNPLPCAAGRRTPAQNAGGHLVIRPGADVLHGPQASGSSGELVCCQWPLLAEIGDRRPPL